MRKIFVIIISIMLFQSCSSTMQSVSIVEDGSDEPKTVEIHLHRPYNYVGSIISFEVYDGQTYIGKLGTDGTLSWKRPAGKLNLRVPKPYSQWHTYAGGSFTTTVQSNRSYFYSIDYNGIMKPSNSTDQMVDEILHTQVLPPTDRTLLTEQDFKDYYNNNLNNLDPIEGFWRYSGKENIRVGNESRNYDNPGIYIIAVIKDTLNDGMFKGWLIESKKEGWPPGYLKVKYRKIRNSFYEQSWFMADYSKKEQDIMLDNDNYFEWEFSMSEYRNNYLVNVDSYGYFIKMYPLPDDEANNASGGSGSGFMISEEGIFVTNYHVVDNGTEYSVNIPSINKSFDAYILIKDKINDLAVLKIDDFEFSEYFETNMPYTLANNNSAKVGQEVYTMGFPLGNIMGSESRLSSGRINSLLGINDDPRLIQMSVPLQPGNSGGILLNFEGEIVGIAVSQLNAQYFYENMGIIPQNINFAVKSIYLENLLHAKDIFKDVNTVNRLKSLPIERQVELINPFIVQIISN